MKCKHAEELILEMSQAALDPAIQAALDIHLLNCPECASFSAKFLMIHQGSDKIKAPMPSKKLLDETTALCQSELVGRAGAVGSAIAYRSVAEKPKFIWIAPLALLILTVVCAFPILKELAKNQIITQQTIYVFTIIIQNILMLIFAPVLLRGLKLKSNWIYFQ